MPDSTLPLIESIHAAPAEGVLAITGGGSGAISQLLETPGASRTVLEAVVPYAAPALAGWVGGLTDGACSEPTARAMAMRAFERATEIATTLAGGGHPVEVFGVGCTASLVSERPKRGAHRLHVALQTTQLTAVWSLVLEKGERSRAAEERIATSLVLHAVACGVGLREVDSYTAEQGDELTCRKKHAPWLWIDMVAGDGRTALIDPAIDRGGYTARPRYKRVLFPGAFAPPHAGHQRMIEIAEQRLGLPVTLELSLTNVDKPPLDYLAIDDRLQWIAEVCKDREVWLTRLPTFQQKAGELSPQVFVVGADTLLRIADPRYYEDDETQRNAAIEELTARGVRFLVFGRTVQGEFQSLEDLPIPSNLRDVCDGVPENDFREEISSTAVRSQDGT